MKQIITLEMEDSAVEIAALEAEGGVSDYHVMIHLTNPRQTYEEQLDLLLHIYNKVKREQLSEAVPVFKRYFLSDAANQADRLQEREAQECAVSIVEQPPLNGTKLALWAYLQTGVTTCFRPNGLFEVREGGLRHMWITFHGEHGGDSYTQTEALLTRYAGMLEEEGCTLAGHCLRTWFFVPDIDSNYTGVVKARNAVFDRHRLTPDTHYIASTGIGGRYADAGVKVLMDAYAVAGITPDQIRYLYAPTHLNPTYEYGVSFERGVCVEYADRRQVLISGTASINNKGEIMYPGDVRRQTIRMWENVEALLQEAGCSYEDVLQMIVYLRDRADYEVVKEMFDQRFPGIPRVMLYAPVCRPGWLVEMECIGCKLLRDR